MCVYAMIFHPTGTVSRKSEVDTLNKYTFLEKVKTGLSLTFGIMLPLSVSILYFLFDQRIYLVSTDGRGGILP